MEGSKVQHSVINSQIKSKNYLVAKGFKEKNVGKHFKSTKTKFKWKIEINGKLHKIVLTDSSWGKKRRVYHNKILISEQKKDKNNYVEKFHSEKEDKSVEAEFIIMEEGKKKKYNL